MKILNICMKSPFSENFNYQDNLLPEYQLRLGNDVTILTGTRSRNNKGIIIEVLPERKVLDNGVRLIRIASGGKLRQFLGFYPKIKKIINELSPDLIFVHSLCTFVPAQALAYKKKHNGVILVADNHQDKLNTRITGTPFSQVMKMWRLLWKYWGPYFSRVYGTTSWRTDFAIKEYSIPEEKTDTLVMGVDVARFPQDTGALRKEMRAKLGVLDNEFLFVTGGKISSRFHRMEAVRAFAKYAGDNSKLLIFGSIEESLKDEFNEIMQQDSRVIYIGFIDSKDVYKYFFASDFGLFSGAHSVLWEEAIGCSLPCLFSKYGNNDHLQVCGNCIQIESCVTEEIIGKQLKKVENYSDFYEKLKENAVQAAHTFSYYAIAKKSLEMLNAR